MELDDALVEVELCETTVGVVEVDVEVTVDVAVEVEVSVEMDVDVEVADVVVVTTPDDEYSKTLPVAESATQRFPLESNARPAG